MKHTVLHFSIIFSLFFISGCTAQNEEDFDPFADSLSYLALGDSYTIGESVPLMGSWPSQLVGKLLGTDPVAGSIGTKVIATTGWTTAELMQGIAAEAPDSTYDLVSLLIGVNNQFRGYDFEIYETELVQLVDWAIALAGGDTSNVFMVSIPNYGVTPFGQSRGEDRIRQELLQYDEYANQVADEYGIPFFNITPISEKAKEDPSYIAEDRLHPSGKMYGEWVDLMLEDVKNLIRGQ